ncbi:hypothetical protein [Nonomuraea roseola]|uniref:Uncharacterized protein n=1 Tax=Nonomuraea roseola TaxID=46179 RepID=A0ABV5Q0N8_9ACTN
MTLPKVTDAEMIDTLKAVVAEKPDYVYGAPEHMADGTGQCYYVHTDAENEEKLAPGCLVGVALNRLGVPLETLQKHEADNAFCVIGRVVEGISDVALEFAHLLQIRQDNGATWGEALAYVEARKG